MLNIFSQIVISVLDLEYPFTAFVVAVCNFLKKLFVFRADYTCSLDNGTAVGNDLTLFSVWLYTTCTLIII